MWAQVKRISTTDPLLMLLFLGNFLLYLFLLWLIGSIPCGSTQTVSDAFVIEGLLRTPGALALIVLSVGMFVAGFYRVGDKSLPLILFGYFCFSTALFLTPQMLSSDVYLYAMQGRIFSIYGDNPYLLPPSHYPHDPFFGLFWEYMNTKPAAYGPVWLLLSSAFAAIATSSVDLTVFVFRLVALIVLTTTLLILLRLTENHAPKKRNRIVYLFAWNPWLLIEFANNAHNDVWMVMLSMWSLLLLRQRRVIASGAVLLLGALVKYSLLAAGPFYLITAWKWKGLTPNKLGIAFLLCLVIVAASVYPFFNHSYSILDALVAIQNTDTRPLNQFNPLLLSLALFAQKFELRCNSLLFFGLWTGRLVFLLIYLGLVVRMLRAKSEGELPVEKASAIALLLFALLVPGAHMPWYLTWGLVYLIVSGITSQAMLLSCVGLMAYSLGYSLASSVIAIYLPAILYLYLTRLVTRLENNKKKLN